jgi:hypothetical protein
LLDVRAWLQVMGERRKELCGAASACSRHCSLLCCAAASDNEERDPHCSAGDDGEEDDFSTELAAQLRQELALQQDSTPPVLVGQGVESAAGRQAAPDLGAISEATVDLMMDGEHVDWQEQEPEAAAAAQAASGGWSRVIRTPRKRSGHVVLDFCSAAPAQQAGGEGAGGVEGQPHRQEGVLLRQVISKAASRREAGGTAAYRLARRMRWGDLWPRHYQERFRADEAPSTQQV